MTWSGEFGPCQDFISYTMAFAIQLRIITEYLSEGSQTVLGLDNGNRDPIATYVTNRRLIQNRWSGGEDILRNLKCKLCISCHRTIPPLRENWGP
jgi:hypothetical protein